MAIVMGLDQHRAKIAAECTDTCGFRRAAGLLSGDNLYLADGRPVRLDGLVDYVIPRALDQSLVDVAMKDDSVALGAAAPMSPT